MGLTIFCVDTADSVSREMVEAGLVNGKDMIVGKYVTYRNLWPKK